MKRIVLSLLATGVLACSPQSDLEENVEGAPEAPVAAGEPALGEEVSDRVTADDLSEWTVQLDDPAGDAAGFQLVVQEGGLSVSSGPAGIAWRRTDLVMEGNFTVSATFADAGSAPPNAEGYGMVVGGKNLDSPDLQYTYFLVRSTGEYLIKRRNGAETEVLVDWKESDTPEPAAPAGAGSRPSSRLAVEVRGDEVRFLRDGAVVETLPVGEARPYGFAGVRVNHGLDVRVTDWSLQGEGVGQLRGRAPEGESESDTSGGRRGG